MVSKHLQGSEMTPGPVLGSKLTPGTLLRDNFKEPLVRLRSFVISTSQRKFVHSWVLGGYYLNDLGGRRKNKKWIDLFRWKAF